MNKRNSITKVRKMLMNFRKRQPQTSRLYSITLQVGALPFPKYNVRSQIQVMGSQRGNVIIARKQIGVPYAMLQRNGASRIAHERIQMKASVSTFGGGQLLDERATSGSTRESRGGRRMISESRFS